MKCYVRKLLSTALILMLLCPVSAFADGDGRKADAENSRLRVELLNRYAQDSTVNQILFVSHTEGSRATAKFYCKTDDGMWQRSFTADAYVGKNGMGKEQEGDGKTPYGEYTVTGAFGILKNPGTELEYLSVTGNTYACDEDCEYYNRIIDTAAVGHSCGGERMASFVPEYNYGLTIDFNSENIYPQGSSIFIHCMGAKQQTAGCVALSENNMKTLLINAKPGMRVYIDEYYVQE